MITTLAFRHLLVRKTRALFLLLGYGLGVGVMIVLLSVGRAMLDQSRDVSLVGGGDLTVLPQGIDVEAMRTGGVSGMFFGIDRARFLTRQLLGGRRHAGLVSAVSPGITNKLLYVGFRGDTVPVRAAGDVPSRAAAVGAGIRVIDGHWTDTPADSAWIAPTPEQLYHELDRFHIPPVADSAWGEWHYFNVAAGPQEWWYISYLVGGRVGKGRWGGQVLVSHRRPDGTHERYTLSVPSSAIRLDTTRADLALGPNRVRQRGGVYYLNAALPGSRDTLRLDLTIVPDRNRYFPPVDLREGEYRSGYVVPALSATAAGSMCRNRRCVRLSNAPAYHDHNWGVWRGVTWEWGTARGAALSLLYGAVYAPDDGAAGRQRLFVALVDSLGVRQVLRADAVRFAGRDRARPDSLSFVAARERDTVHLTARITGTQATRTGAAGMGRVFLQMRGEFRLTGTLDGERVADRGVGYFETYLRREK